MARLGAISQRNLKLDKRQFGRCYHRRGMAGSHRLLGSIDDELATITHRCRGPADVGALRKTEQIIDHSLASFRHHPLLGPVIVEMTKQHHGLIIDQCRPAPGAGLKILPWIKP